MIEMVAPNVCRMRTTSTARTMMMILMVISRLIAATQPDVRLAG
jgi:hypothetical protein